MSIKALGGVWGRRWALNAASVHSAMDEGRFHISPSVNSDLPLLALYSEGSSLIDAESILQSNADSLLHDAELNIESFQAPVGALEFSLSGDDESAIDVVNIAMTAGGVQLNRLYKSTNDAIVLIEFANPAFCIKTNDGLLDNCMPHAIPMASSSLVAIITFFFLIASSIKFFNVESGTPTKFSI